MRNITIYLLTLMLFTFLMQPTASNAQSNIETLFNRSSSNYEKVKVVKIHKADLIELDTGEIVQLIGLNAPEPPADMFERYEKNAYGVVMEKRAEDPRYSVEENSYIFASELLEGKFVRLEFDVEKSDDKYHTFAYVYLVDNGVFVNSEILRNGYANLRIIPPNMKYANELRAAYQEARKNFRGLHGD